MAIRKKINLNTILKRSSCINSINESVNIPNVKKSISDIYHRLESIGEINHIIKSDIKIALEKCTNTTNANEYYHDLLSIIETCGKIDYTFTNQLVKDFNSRVLPYIDDVYNVAEAVSRLELDQSHLDWINEAIFENTAADRILKNHDKLSKRFHMEINENTIKGKGLKFVVEEFCSKIDTYRIESYHKMNLCIEEMTYLLKKNGIEYNSSELVENIVEYFLINNVDLTSQDIKGYRKVLSENGCISDEDIIGVDYLMNPSEEISNTIVGYIKDYLIKQDKDFAAFNQMVDWCINSSDYLDIVNNTDKIIQIIWDVYKSDIYDTDQMEKYIRIWMTDIHNRIYKIAMNNQISKEELSKYVDTLSYIKDNLNDSNSTWESDTAKYTFVKSITDMIGSLNSLNGIIYNKSNLDAIEFVNTDTSVSVPVSEFKLFKFNNLAKAAFNLDRYLANKIKVASNKVVSKIKKAGNKFAKILFPENSSLDKDSIYSFIGEDTRVDICVAQFEVAEEDMSEIHNFLSEVCKEFNSKSQYTESFRAYYVTNPGVAEVHIKDATLISMEESDWVRVHESDNEDLDIYIEKLAYTETVSLLLQDLVSDNCSVDEKLNSVFENYDISVDDFSLILCALSIVGVEKDRISVIAENYMNYRYSDCVLESVISEAQYHKDEIVIERALNHYEAEEDRSFYEQVEAILLMEAILEASGKPKVGGAAIKKDNSEQAKKDEEKTNPMKGINLNNLKLALTGLKAKAKDMSQKEKEFSRNLDNEARRLVKSMKQALISDRREAIIKGSVIPSFSKCLKIAVGLILVAKIPVYGPAIAIISAVGGFAASKRLTKKERLLLLDDIDIELKVIEKEISEAESAGKTKKYRELLRIQKDLQRQYNRIKYNLRVGQDILAGSVGHGTDD